MTATPRSSGLIAALGEKRKVYHALITRFIIGRYGRENIGFLWTIVEPMMLCTGVMAIWAVTKGSAYHGVNVVAFVFTGYMPLTLWRHQTSPMINIAKYVKFLTTFRGISILDAILAKLVLEFLSVTGASIVVFCVLFFFNMIEAPYSIQTVFIGWMIMAAICSSTGILLAAVSETNEVIEKINQPFQYFLIPFCGCFFMVDWLPDSVKGYLLLIPLVHAYEIIREGFFGPAAITYGSAPFALGSALLTAGVGFFLYERVKDRIQA